MKEYPCSDLSLYRKMDFCFLRSTHYYSIHSIADGNRLVISDSASLGIAKNRPFDQPVLLLMYDVRCNTLTVGNVPAGQPSGAMAGQAHGAEPRGKTRAAQT